jgi:hypothetical protein
MSKRYFTIVLVGLIFFSNGFANNVDEVSAAIIVADTSNQMSNVSKFLNTKKWEELFPNRYHLSQLDDAVFKGIPQQDFYSYEAFFKAAKLFPLFLGNGNDSTQKRELAAFLANMSYETSGGWDNAPGGIYKWGLYFIQEKGFPKTIVSDYNDSSKKKWPPVLEKSYHGRGPMQLSWNYNYGQFSEAYFGNKQVLLDNPDLLLQDPVLCFASAIWFWVRDQYPKPSCHNIMTGQWEPTEKDIAGNRRLGFGAVVNVINGGLECGDNYSDRSKYRYGFYKYFCNYLKINQGPNADCSNQKPFGQ